MPTAHEKFATLFDMYPSVMTGGAASAGVGTRAFDSTGGAAGHSVMPASSLELATPQPIYGFGNASIRFNNVEYPGQSHGLVNKQVIALEDGDPLPTGTHLGPGAPSSFLPGYAQAFKPEEGRSFGRTPGFGPDDAGKSYVLPKPHFVNGRLTDPDVVEVGVPRGASADPRSIHEVPVGVVTPLERREAMAFEKAMLRARKEHRAEKAAHVRRAQLMRQAHPRGLFGVEAPGHPSSGVYADQTAQVASRTAASAAHAAARAENLRTRGNSMVGHPLLEHNPTNGAQDKIFQSRQRAPFSSDQWGSRGEGFFTQPASGTSPLRQPNNNQERRLVPPDPARTQHLYNELRGGRNFDIITGVEAPIKCTVPESHDLRRAHESHIAAANSKATMWAGGLGRFGTKTVS